MHLCVCVCNNSQVMAERVSECLGEGGFALTYRCRYSNTQEECKTEEVKEECSSHEWFAGNPPPPTATTTLSAH